MVTGARRSCGARGDIVAERFVGRPPSFRTCWRRVWKTVRTVVRDSSVVDLDVVAVGVGREESVDARGP